MTVTLSIKNVPDELARRLKQRAARHHRSLQGESLAIVEAAAGHPARSLASLAILRSNSVCIRPRAKLPRWFARIAMIQIVDASAIGAVLLVEREAARVNDQTDGMELVAPAITPFEVGNMLWEAARRSASDAGSVMAIWAAWTASLPVRLVPAGSGAYAAPCARNRLDILRRELSQAGA